MKNRLLIYLGDLDHITKGNRISVPLNIASIASYCKNLFGDVINIKLFKDPHRLVKEIKEHPPNILGLSFYMWNANLSLKIIEICKLISPSTITLLGGPSIARNTNKDGKLLNSSPYLDMAVIDQGEKSFSNVISAILSKGKDKFSIESIPGCTIRLNNSNKITRGKIVEDDKDFLNKFPSPYLKGYLDPFLKSGFLPLLETIRGCPYSCTYCGQGDNCFSKLQIKNEETVYNELLYLLKHSKSNELCVTDSNVGIMGERDRRIISFMTNLYKRFGFPLITDLGSSKIKTNETIEIMKIVANNNGCLYLGLQTLTEQVLKNCKRKNVSTDTIKNLIYIARENNWSVSTDLIFGLPGETAQSFLKTMSQLLSWGIDRVPVYNLKLLPGTEISENEREKYKYKTKFRPINNRYGEYNLIPGKKTVRIIEAEEIAYESNSFNKEDYMLVRKYGFLTELLVSYGALPKTLIFLSSRGIDLSKIFELIFQKLNEYPKLSKLLKEYDKFSNEELFESEEELISNICGDDEQWNDILIHKGKYFKINFGFIGYCLFENKEVLKDIESIIRNYLMKEKSDELENFNEIVKYDKFNQIIPDKKERRLKESDIKKEIIVEEKFDYKKWILNGYKGKLSNYKYAYPIQSVYYIEGYKEMKKAIKEFGSFSTFNFYERIMMEVATKNIRRLFGGKKIS